MEMIKATVQEIDEKRFIRLETEGEEIKIPLSEDKPNDVKSAFNKLIARVTIAPCQIKLEDPGEDLFSQVAKEYVIQLNREIQQVRKEMEHYGLVKG